MQEAVPVGEGGMIAILGLKIEEVEKYLNSVIIKNGVCEIANDNAEGQVIASGDINSINELQKFLKEKKIKSIPLKVSAPFHCALMKPAANKMKEKIDGIEFTKPKIPIINNVTAKEESNPEFIKSLLVEQIYSTVKWRESLININNKNIKNYVEIGPGKALSGMVKRTLKNSNSFSINSIDDIKNLINEFKK
jgi:[acyl-carrier-protein] S-malonyltransferase